MGHGTVYFNTAHGKSSLILAIKTRVSEIK